MAENTILASSRLFAGVSAQALAALEGVCVQRVFAVGAVIINEGDPSPPVDLIFEGHVRVFRSGNDGREQSFHVLGPGEALNLVPAFDGVAVSASTVTALTDARLGRISGTTFRRVVSQNPELSLAVMHYMAERLRHVSGLAAELALASVPSRLASFLLSQFSEEADGEVRWTREQMAARIGSVREVVSRTLSEFKSAGLIDIDRDRIILLDTERLALLAKV